MFALPINILHKTKSKNMNTIKLYFLLLFTLPFFTQAQVLLKDINTANNSSHPYSAFDLNGSVLFIANNQLWKSDGTIGNTTLVINPNQYPYYGPNFNNNSSLKLRLNNNMLFVADGYNTNGDYVGTELWKTDGTNAGTSLLADINSGGGSSNPTLLTVIGNYAYFSAYNPSTGNELWSTDGNTVNFLGDIASGTNSNHYYFDSFAALGTTKMIFKAFNNSFGTELWITDGTEAGTFILKDISSGSTSTNIYDLTNIGSKVYFSANDPTYGVELWVTDGTSDGTHMVLDIYSPSCLSCSSYPTNFRELNGNLIFTAQSSALGTEIWKSDGTAAGTSVLKNIYPSSTSSDPQYLTKVGSKIFFTAENGIVGRELWATDGTSAGTNLVKDINQNNSVGNLSFPNNNSVFINVNGTLFFLANSGIEGYELWKSDGTTSGTLLVKDFLPTSLSGSYSNFMVAGSKLYFIVDENGVKKMCVSDGTPNGSQALNTIAPNVDMSNAYPLIGIGNTLYFTAFHSLYGYEIYKTDGTSAGTSFLKDIKTDPFSNFGFSRTVSNDNSLLAFNYNNNKNGMQIWRTDGSTLGTIEAANINPYPILNPNVSTEYYAGTSSIGQIVNFKNEFYITINGSIWKTDGINPPVIFKGSNSYGLNYSTNTMAVSNGKLFFHNPDDKELWATDGSEAGTYLVKEIAGEFDYIEPTRLIDVNGILFFRAYDATNGYELWKSDGTTGGTVLVKDITPGNSSTVYYENDYVKVGNKLYIKSGFFSPYQLFVSDGTSVGTFPVKSSNLSMGILTNLNDNLLIFSSTDPTYGTELWSSNGTVGGTNMVKDIYIGSNSSSPTMYTNNRFEFAVYNSKAYFRAYDGVSNKFYVSDGTNIGTYSISNFIPNTFCSTPFGMFFNTFSNSGIYKSDGTTNGTILVSDIVTEGFYANFYYSKNLLYFLASTATTGTEIFVMKLCDDNLNQTTTLSGNQSYQVNNTIQATNIINPNARVSYKAGKSIELNPGFKTDSPTGVFFANIDACIHHPENAPLVPKKSAVSASALQQTQTYLNDIKTIPTIEAFLAKSINKNFTNFWYKFNAEKAEIEAKISRIDKTKQEGAILINQLTQKLNEYRQSVKFNKDKNGKITEYILTLQSEMQSESETISVK
jgi:trimeric autotransporter adhesin